MPGSGIQESGTHNLQPTTGGNLMVLEVRPLKNKCNLACKYCYENTLKDAGNAKDFCEIEAVKSLLKKEDRPFALFGGEPLLLDEKELESFFSLGFERYKRNIIQTNGTLINDNHIRMFGQYKAVVGISIDGPGECNDLRWAGTLEKTREATAKTENAILRLCSENIPTALIVTLHRQNAVREKLPVMLDWLRGLIRKGPVMSACTFWKHITRWFWGDTRFLRKRLPRPC